MTKASAMATKPKRNPAKNSDLDPRFTKAKQWRAEGEALRAVLLESGLNEELKWGKPCYSDDGKNIVIIQRMKAHLALMFFRGALLKDSKKVLKKQGPNSRSACRIEFTSVEQVADLRPTIKTYIREAITIAKAGLEVPKADKLVLVEELAQQLAREPKLKAAFEALTPGRQREYNLHVSSAKQVKTRIARVAKYAPKILAGKGFRDR